MPTGLGDPELQRLVRSLTRNVAGDLVSLYHNSVYRGNERTRSHLILPATRLGSPTVQAPSTRRRTSEQESRMILALHLERLGRPYAVEVPTTLAYRQKGLSWTSARSDLTVFRSPSPDDRLLNIEFKCKSPEKEQYRKDLEKLFCEGVSGLWFQTLTARLFHPACQRLLGVVESALDCNCMDRSKTPVCVPSDQREFFFAFCSPKDRWLRVAHAVVEGNREKQMEVLKGVLSADPNHSDSWWFWKKKQPRQ